MGSELLFKIALWAFINFQVINLFILALHYYRLFVKEEAVWPLEDHSACPYCDCYRQRYSDESLEMENNNATDTEGGGDYSNTENDTSEMEDGGGNSREGGASGAEGKEDGGGAPRAGGAFGTEGKGDGDGTSRMGGAFAENKKDV